MSINHVLKRHCTKHNEKPFDLAIDSITEADSFQLTALIDSLKAPCLKKTQDKLDKDIYNLGKCVLGIFQKYASETYPEEWKIEEDQEVDRTVRLVVVDPNQEHIDACKKESIREYTRAHNEALGART